MYTFLILLCWSFGLWLLSPLPAIAAAFPTPLAVTQTSAYTPTLHVLNRLAYGPRPGDLQQLAQQGIDRYIQTQLNPDSLPEPVVLTQQLQALETLRMSPVQLAREFAPAMPTDRPNATPQQRQNNRQRIRNVVGQAVQARLLRATYSPRQLQEVMTEFWFNHFNVFVGKGLTRLWVGAYENQAIRPHTLGRFRDLLGATARHPAMLFYLDNWQNTAPNSLGARGRFQGLNENYARELMELHTLGVNGGYTQADIIALARIFTGWGLQRPRSMGGSGSDRNDGNGFSFAEARHDFSDKVFLGQTIKGSGQAEGKQALDILARHPATAKHISYKLAQYFVADEPPSSLVQTLSQRYLATDGDIRAVLQTLFQSAEFRDPRYYQTKFKTPYRYVVSAIRASGATNPDFRPIFGMLQQLGMPLYGCQTPDGYKNVQEAWLNPDAMVRRVSFATAIAGGYVKGIPAIDSTTLQQTLGDAFSGQTQQVVQANPVELRAALVLGSPEFMKY